MTDQVDADKLKAGLYKLSLRWARDRARSDIKVLQGLLDQRKADLLHIETERANYDDKKEWMLRELIVALYDAGGARSLTDAELNQPTPTLELASRRGLVQVENVGSSVFSPGPDRWVVSLTDTAKAQVHQMRTELEAAGYPPYKLSEDEL